MFRCYKYMIAWKNWQIFWLLQVPCFQQKWHMTCSYSPLCSLLPSASVFVGLGFRYRSSHSEQGMTGATRGVILIKAQHGRTVIRVIQRQVAGWYRPMALRTYHEPISPLSWHRCPHVKDRWQVARVSHGWANTRGSLARLCIEILVV